jgi:hypothetical protein
VLEQTDTGPPKPGSKSGPVRCYSINTSLQSYCNGTCCLPFSLESRLIPRLWQHTPVNKLMGLVQAAKADQIWTSSSTAARRWPPLLMQSQTANCVCRSDSLSLSTRWEKCCAKFATGEKGLKFSWLGGQVPPERVFDHQ